MSASARRGQSLAGRVAVVTGSGRGIGRGIAELLANQGAAVVVNDLGCSEEGAGEDVLVADEVVRSIRERGGVAVANAESVTTREGAESIVKTAVQEFGRLDILVTVAGILRERMIFNMTEEEWDDVLAVHLKGTAYCTQAALPYLRQSAHGRLITFTSTAGLLGSAGQPNYSAAKDGIVSLTRSVALAEAGSGVTANCISPSGDSRLNARVPADRKKEKPAEVPDSVSARPPEAVAPMVAYLAGEHSDAVTGQTFLVTGGHVQLIRQPRPLKSMHRKAGWTAEAIGQFLPWVLLRPNAEVISAWPTRDFSFWQPPGALES